jgi:uncharacterized protein (DUF302 family)
MYYIVETDKSVSRATVDLETAVKKHGFGVLHVHDLKQTLANKGFTLPSECRIYEICQPAQALKVLTADMNLNMALPCRVSVYEQNGRTRIGTIRPTEMLGLLSEDSALAAIAHEVDTTIEAIIDEAAAT